MRFRETWVRAVDRAEVLDDIRIAEDQVARGEGIAHEDAEQRLPARFPQLRADDVPQGVQ